MALLRLNIDGKSVEVDKGTTILAAARSNGIKIPTHCYDESLQPYGGCRLCMVEICRNDRKRLVASCVYEAEEGLVVRTRTPKIDSIRRMIIELTWPNLSHYAQEYGARANRFDNGNRDCTLCGKCVRFCAESGLADIVYFKGRGINRDVDLTPDRNYDYGAYQKCMSYCSAGRLRDKIMELWSK